MKQRIQNIYRLGVKELYSLRYDPVMVFLIIYAFTLAVYIPAKGSRIEFLDASIAIVDEDRSRLSQRIADAFLPPYFEAPERLEIHEIDAAMDAGRYTFIIDIPPEFEADVLGQRGPTIQVNVDATAMTQAGRGSVYVQSIIDQEVTMFLQRDDTEMLVPLRVRVKFNPNLNSSWFLSVMQLINSITLLAIVLTGAALIREREHGTIEHLLVMPLRPAEIMLAKVWANGLVIAVAATLTLWLVVQKVLEVPIAGSIALFVSGTAIYLFSVTALGIFLATLARSMQQFGLLAIPVFLVMNFLSGSTTPLESIPQVLQLVTQFSPSTHFVSFAQAILYRGAGFDVVWPEFVAVAMIGAVFFTGALVRFRKTVTLTHL